MATPPTTTAVVVQRSLANIEEQMNTMDSHQLEIVEIEEIEEIKEIEEESRHLTVSGNLPLQVRKNRERGVTMKIHRNTH